MTALCMLVFVIACFGYYFTTDQTTSVSPDPVTSFSWVAIFVLSIRSVFLTYTGWNSSVYFIEEDTNPQQHLPRSLIYGVVSVIIIYTLLNLGLIAVLPLAEMAKSNLPAAEAASLIFGDSGGMVITLIAIVSLIACLGATMLIAARILFAVARAGLIFKSFGDLNANAIPGKALLMTAFISILFSSTGLFNVVVNMGALFAMIADLSVYISILFIRPKNLSIKAPYQAWAYPWGPVTMVIITLGLIIGLFMEDTRICLYVLGALACVFPFYFIVRRNAKFDKPVIN